MPVQILMVEDSSEDVMLVAHELERGGLDVVIERVEDEKQLRQALGRGSWDIVIADYVLPQFSGLEALEIVKKNEVDIPFIIVSGKIDEDTAVDAMRAGVRDFVVKDRLSRLVPAIRRELNNALLRQEHDKAQKALEKAREHMERQRFREFEMKLLGQLVSGIAHEVRNPLNAITALLEALFQEIGTSDIIAPYHKHIETQVVRLNRLMLDLLELGKPVNDKQFRKVNMAELCKLTLTHWNDSASGELSIVNFADESPRKQIIVRGDTVRLEQALINLIENASEHSRRKNRIQMVLNKSGEFARVAIIDDGTGIKPEYLDLIFDPFFTTRKSGTGLGLGICRHIIEAHGGTIHLFNNEPPPGVTAEVFLPIAES